MDPESGAVTSLSFAFQGRTSRGRWGREHDHHADEVVNRLLFDEEQMSAEHGHSAAGAAGAFSPPMMR